MERRILITGASSGIGQAAALALAKPHTQLILTARNEARLSEVRDRCVEAGSAVQMLACDLAAEDSIPLLRRAMSGFEGYPTLINSAGLGVFGLYADLAWEDIENQFRINFLAPARLIHALLPEMLESGGGQIINVLSMTCAHLLPGSNAYAASKSGLLSLSRLISAEHRSQGIKVTNLLPGAVATPLWDGSPMQTRLAEMIPVEEIAKAIVGCVEAPHTFNLDEALIMPPGGVL